MILRLLIVAMMLLAIAKYYLHDSKSAQQTRPQQQVEAIKNQLDDIQRQQEERRKQQLNAMGVEN
ncbi:MAG: hypothetical protein HWE18_00070 [Gammaproteobacteria bacterium]|nr:hypothetical protein [Gammaproteobacteria bacterium]